MENKFEGLEGKRKSIWEAFGLATRVKALVSKIQIMEDPLLCGVLKGPHLSRYAAEWLTNSRSPYEVELLKQQSFHLD